MATGPLQQYLQSKDAASIVPVVKAMKHGELVDFFADAIEHALQGTVDIIAMLLGALLQNEILPEEAFSAGL